MYHICSPTVRIYTRFLTPPPARVVLIPPVPEEPVKPVHRPEALSTYANAPEPLTHTIESCADPTVPMGGGAFHICSRLSSSYLSVYKEWGRNLFVLFRSRMLTPSALSLTHLFVSSVVLVAVPSLSLLVTSSRSTCR